MSDVVLEEETGYYITRWMIEPPDFGIEFKVPPGADLWDHSGEVSIRTILRYEVRA